MFECLKSGAFSIINKLLFLVSLFTGNILAKNVNKYYLILSR